MPLSIPSRTTNPFFAQQRRRTLPVLTNEDEVKTDDTSDELRLFPLESDAEPLQNRRKAVPAQPLRHQQKNQQPRTPQQAGLGHASVVPEFSMAPPMMTHSTRQPHMREPIMPLGTRQPHMQEPIMPHSARTPLMQEPIMPHNMRPGHMPPPAASAQPSQDQAVNQFRRANQGLPDGVRYEPLDETTMKLLRDNGHLPAQPTPTQPTQQMTPPLPSLPTPTQTAPTPTSSDKEKIIKILEGIIQDERNAHVFYSHFADVAKTEQHGPALADIAKDCMSNTAQFSAVLSTNFGSNFTPTDAEINTALELKNAISLALLEESKSLRMLSDLLEIINQPEAERVIQRIVNKKMVNLNLLTRFAHVTQ